MQKKEYILILLFLGLAISLTAQTSGTIINRSTHLSLSYNGSIIYPGARFGLEMPVKSIKLLKKKSNGEQTIIKDRFVTAQLGWYHHPSFHDNLYLTGGLIWRRIHQKGFFTQFSPEIGYSRTFLGGTTYHVDEKGAVYINKLAGYSYLLLMLGAGVGYDLEKTKHQPFAFYSKINALMMVPYNSTFYLRPTLELGIIYQPKNFLPRKVKLKAKPR